MALISYFGPAGSFTHRAAFKRFGGQSHFIPGTSISEVFDEVKSDKAAVGVVPIYNTTGGFVNDTVDELLRTEFVRTKCQITEELEMDIRLCLMGRGHPRGVRRIYSHSYPLKYSRAWVAQRFPKAEIIVASSTSAAAERASRERGAAAIGSEDAATLYGLRVWETVRGRTKNITQFITFGKRPAGPMGALRTAIGFGLEHKPGTLAKILSGLASHNLNLTRIVSRPFPGKMGEYIFLVDFEGDSRDARVQKALKQVKESTTFLHMLGTYRVLPKLC